MLKIKRFFVLFLILVVFSACSSEQSRTPNGSENKNSNEVSLEDLIDQGVHTDIDANQGEVSDEELASENNAQRVSVVDEVVNETDQKDEAQTNRGQYINSQFGIKFDYAKIDPLYNTKCEIKEKGNEVSNSCGYKILLMQKDPNLSNLDFLNSLIPDKNRDYCEVKMFYNEASQSKYNIELIYEKIPASAENLDIICGQYTTSAMGHRYAFLFDSNHPNRFVVIIHGGHAPEGVLELKEDGRHTIWFDTIKFF